MSYTIDFVVPPLPKDNGEAWEFAQSIIDGEPEEGTPHAALVRLHDIITSVYPCLSSYARDDMAIDKCPWSDGPLIRNFGQQSGRIGIQTGREFEGVPSFVTNVAVGLGISVLDPQTEQIRRGDTDMSAGRTYRIFVRGVEPGLKPEQVAATVAARFKRDPSEVLKLLAEKGNFVRGLDWVSGLRDLELLSNFGCLCAISPEQ